MVTIKEHISIYRNLEKQFFQVNFIFLDLIMKLENSRNNMRALAQAADGEKTLLITPSGKFKQDTFFERSIGCGKKLLAKIQGGSYEFKKISFESAKNEVQAKLSRQIHFFSGITKINADDRRLIDGMSKQFIEEQMPEKARKYIKAPFDIRARQNQAKFQNAVTTIKSLESNEKSIVSKIKNQILDEKYFYLKVKNTNDNILPHEIDTTTIDEISKLAAILIEYHGESMRNAIILSRLMKSDELKGEADTDTRYQIAKNFSDSYLFNIKEKMAPGDFSIKLTGKKNEISNRKYVD
jgi:hypothetical protein